MAIAELKPEDFESPEAIEKASARILAEHFNFMHRIVEQEILSVFEFGKLSIETVRALLQEPESNE